VIVDDSPMARTAMRQTLEAGSRQTYQIEELDSGTAAIVLCRERPPDCVILDYYLPDLDAPEVLKALRAPGGGMSCPVLVLTDTAGSELSAEVLGAGAQDYLAKGSVTPQTLARAVENAIERWKMAVSLIERQQQLTRSESLLRLALEASATGIWVWDISSDAVTWSSECYRLLGFAEDGTRITGQLFFSLIHPEDRDRVEIEVRGATARHETFSCEFRVVRPDGTVVWVQNLRRAGYAPDGQPLHMTGTVTDISARKAAELELAAARQQLEAIIENMSEGLCLADSTGRLVRTNQAAIRILGEEPAYDLKGPLALLLREGSLQGTVYTLTRPETGLARSLSFNGTVVRSKTGAPTHALLTFRDVTALSSAEAALREHERELQTLTDAVPDIIARFDRQLRHVFVNAAVGKLTGRPTSDFLGRTNRELGMPAGLCEQWEEAMRAVFATGVPRTMEFAFPSPGMVRQFESRLVAELDAAGRPAYLVAVTIDVTVRKQNEEALRASEERLRALADSMPQLVWRSRADGSVDYFNARIIEYTCPPPLDGVWNWVEMIHPEDRDRTIQTWQKAAASRTAYACEHRVRMADGSWRWHLTRALPVQVSRETTTWYGTSTDIDPQKQVEERLAAALVRTEQAVRARDQLVSLVSHDLRDPLNVMRLSVEMLGKLARGPAVDPSALEHAVSRMARQTDRMGRMLEELLDFTQFQAQRQPQLRLSELDLVPLVSRVAEEHQRAAPRHRIEVVSSTPAVVGRWDGARLERVVGNLVSNAVKYSPDGGKVQVSLAQAQEAGVGWAFVEVSDQGIGIAAEDHARVFDWFSRGQNAERSLIGGHGIGLAGARAIVAQHGGAIALSSAVGKGSIFTVRLPLSGPADERHRP